LISQVGQRLRSGAEVELLLVKLRKSQSHATPSLAPYTTQFSDQLSKYWHECQRYSRVKF
jgi:hypothetical protein